MESKPVLSRTTLRKVLGCQRDPSPLIIIRAPTEPQFWGGGLSMSTEVPYFRKPHSLKWGVSSFKSYDFLRNAYDFLMNSYDFRRNPYYFPRNSYDFLGVL